MSLDDLSNDRQAEARSLRSRREERFENAGTQVVRHTRTAIVNFDTDGIGITPNGHADDTTGGARLDGVMEQSEQRLGQQIGVCADDLVETFG